MTTRDPAGRVGVRDKVRYVRALRFRWLTRFYDPVLRATLRDDIFKRMLIERAGIRPGHRVLDIGCGTGTLTVMAKQYSPHARVVGLDVDPDALAQARARIAAAGVDVGLYEASAIAPPFQGASFDRILSSLVFHHLDCARRRRRAVWRQSLVRQYRG